MSASKATQTKSLTVLTTEPGDETLGHSCHLSPPFLPALLIFSLQQHGVTGLYRRFENPSVSLQNCFLQSISLPEGHFCFIGREGKVEKERQFQLATRCRILQENPKSSSTLRYLHRVWPVLCKITHLLQNLCCSEYFPPQERKCI